MYKVLQHALLQTVGDILADSLAIFGLATWFFCTGLYFKILELVYRCLHTISYLILIARRPADTMVESSRSFLKNLAFTSNSLYELVLKLPK